MSTKKGFWWGALVPVAMLLITSSSASARVLSITDQLPDPGVTTNTSAGIVIWPKIKVDTDEDVDTIVQLTNTSEFLVKVHCFYVNANGHCSNDPDTVCTQATFRDDCPTGGLCIDGWAETDFRLTLTKRQPISWSVNDGLPRLPLNDRPGLGNPPQFNEGNIPPAPEDPFTGELRCIQVGGTDELPIDRNDLKGEATIVDVDGEDAIDVAKYNAIGIPAIAGERATVETAPIDPSRPELGSVGFAQLNLGGPQPNYNGCPNILTLNHFFDRASVATHASTVSGPVVSDLTFVPCSANFLLQERDLATSVLQFLVFNEFEQRFSTSTRVTCYREVQLSDIDTRPGPDGNDFSIFSAGVQGTLTGQSRIRAVAGTSEEMYDGNGVLALLTENWGAGTCEGGASLVARGMIKETRFCASADDCKSGERCMGERVATDIVNVPFQGTRGRGDRMIVPLP